MRWSVSTLFRTACFASAALSCATARPAAALPLPHPDQVIALSIVDQDLAEVLAECGSQAGLRVSVSAAVRGRVHGRLPAAAMGAFLDRLAGTFGFDWYFDGETIYVSALSESGSKLLVLGAVRAEQLSRTLDELGIADPRWPIRNAADAGLGMVNGPPRYLALVEQTLAALPQKRAPSQGVRIFRGSAASFPL